MKNKNIGKIIQIRGDKFLEKFIYDENLSQFQYLLLSSDITTVGEYKNIVQLPSIIPKGSTMEYFLDKKFKKYAKDYKEYLNRDNIRLIITSIVKSAIYHDMDLILMCSKEEQEYKYIDLIRKFIEDEYGVPTYTYKEFKKCRKNDDWKEVDDKRIEKTKNKINKEIKRLNDLNVSLEKTKYEQVKQAKKQVMKLSKSDLKKFCKAKGLKKYKKLDKEQLQQLVIKLIEKESRD